MLSLKDERQWTGYLWLRKKEGHYIREYILCKERLDRKSTQDIYPRRVDKAIRVHFEKCLLCTLYQEEFILSSVKVVISQYMFNLTNVGLSMCVMEYSDLFLNLMWTDPDIFVWKSMKWPTWRDKVGIVLILHDGRKLWWLMYWFIPHWEKSLE